MDWRQFYEAVAAGDVLYSESKILLFREVDYSCTGVCYFEENGGFGIQVILNE